MSDRDKPSRLAIAVRLYCALASIDHKTLAKAIGACPSSVCRFLAGKSLDAATTLRLVSWLLERS